MKPYYSMPVDPGGAAFPNATMLNIQHNHGIERTSIHCFLSAMLVHSPLLESANMLIMSLAHAQYSGDGSLISQHVSLKPLFRPIGTKTSACSSITS